jgi:HAE1 family hydrophobic/amphiphilic exporter-1
MIEALIDRLTRASLRFKWITIGLAVVALVAGVFALTQLKQELIPTIEFPTTVVLAFNSGMEPEALRDQVTIPIEEAVKDIEGVVNIESTTASGVAFIQIQNEFGLDQDALRVEIAGAVEGLTYPEGMETPELLTFGMDDLPLVYASVSSELPVAELKALVESDIVPALEEVPEVADVQVSGGQELPTEPPPTPEPTATLTPEPTLEPTMTPTLEPTVTPTEVPPAPTEDVESELVEPEPVPLPDSWIQAAAAQGMTLETTADLTAQVVAGIASFAPQMLEELTPEMLLAMPLEALAALPEEYLQSLDPELQAQLAERLAPTEPEAEPEADVEEPEPVALPDSWVQAAAAQGITLETTADLTAQVVAGIASFAPQMLEELTAEMLLAMPLDALAALPEEYLESLDPEIQAQLAERLAPTEPIGEPEAAVEEPEPVALPQSWTEGAAARGTKLETTTDLTPMIMRSILLMAPEGLEELTAEMLLAMPLDVLEVLPQDYLDSLDPELQAELAQRVEGGDAEAPEPTAEPTRDPAMLPDMWQAAGQAQGITLVMPEDVTPEIIQGITAMAPQLLQSLTPENLRRFSPEVLAWLPADYIDTLDDDLRAELDELAQPAGGLGALAAQAEAEAEALAADAPELAGLWREAPEEGATGPMPTFETAADLINNGFTDGAAELLNMLVSSNFPQTSELMADLSPEVVAWLAENEEGFLENLSPGVLRLLSPEVLASLPDGFYATLDIELRSELEGIVAGTVEVFVPTETITRVDGNPSLRLTIYKDGEANTVSVTHALYDKMDELEADYSGLRFDITFEQASFIEESISGVTREGALGALFAVLVILLFLSGTVNGRYRLSWRSTLVAGVSIPLSVFMGFALLTWLPPVANLLFEPLANATKDIPVLGVLVMLIYRMFPTDFSLNIMTLSGMTVAVGRVVDDSIVVLENIYRHIQRGEDRRQAVLMGTRDVSIAILASTVTTVIVFMPIGLIGGIVGQFFLPFGITVAYALGSSFLVAVTIVPLLAYLLIRKEHLPDEKETALQRWYTPVLKWALKYRALVLVLAGLLFVGSMFLLVQQPQALLPEMGEPQITASVDLPNGTSMSETVALVAEFEAALTGIDGLGTIQGEIGSGGGMSGMVARLLGAGGVDQSMAGIDIAVEDSDSVDELTGIVREQAEQIFGAENVTVSGASLMSGAFGGFAVVVSGDPEQLAAIDADVTAALEGMEGLANVSSNLADADVILRVGGQPAVRYGGEVETQDAMGLTRTAIAEVEKVVPSGITVSEGFESEQQTRGFQQAVQALFISIVAVYLVMVITFRSFVHPFTILFSLPLAFIGAAVALWLTDRVVGLPALVGLMMLVGIVVTNAIVLIDRVRANRKKRGMDTQPALVEGGRTRLRPILMTAIATILALMPLAIGLTEGALIAAELATVVIGGLFTSTFLTLLIVPVMYSLLDRISTRRRRKT